jgi:hypothetical protein
VQRALHTRGVCGSCVQVREEGKPIAQTEIVCLVLCASLPLVRSLFRLCVAAVCGAWRLGGVFGV